MPGQNRSAEVAPILPPSLLSAASPSAAACSRSRWKANPSPQRTGHGRCYLFRHKLTLFVEFFAHCVVFLHCSLLAGVDASAAQNLPVTKTCLQCGAVLSSSVRACHFCESSFTADFSSEERFSDAGARRDLASSASAGRNDHEYRNLRKSSEGETEQGAAWRSELAQRLNAYRTRRRKLAPNVAQSQFSFEEPPRKIPSGASAAVAEPFISDAEDFSFTIAIGRPSKNGLQEESRMVIDVSAPPEAETCSHAHAQTQPEQTIPQPGLYPVAPIDDRRLAGLVDLGCLLFAYGGFLMLFGSLGGQFTLSKLTAVVYTTTF